MQKITDQQYLHRQYLQTPIWKQKRLEILTYYGCGCVCGRCGDYGNDVHHKTYERVGGGELISDLEVLCSECHKAHHVVEKVERNVKKTSLHVNGLYSYLNYKQKEVLRKRFNIFSDSELRLVITNDTTVFGFDVAKVAAKMLGCEFYGKVSKKALQKRYSPREYRRGYPRNFDTLVWKRVNSLAEL